MKRWNQMGKVTAALVICLVALATAGGAWGTPDEDYTKHPGFVDFEGMKVFGDLEASVEVFLKGALIKMAIAALQHDEPELADVLAPIKLVRVNVFDLRGDEADRLRDKKKAVADKLDKKGWEIAVRVRERDEDVDIYVLPGKNDTIEGLVVMVVEDRGEAVFVNVVGTIQPEDIGRIGHGLDIDVLDDLKYHDMHETKKDKSKERTHNP